MTSSLRKSIALVDRQAVRRYRDKRLPEESTVSMADAEGVHMQHLLDDQSDNRRKMDP
jgi:hypothetical protein